MSFCCHSIFIVVEMELGQYLVLTQSPLENNPKLLLVILIIVIVVISIAEKKGMINLVFFFIELKVNMILPIIPLNPRSRYWLSSQAQGQRESNELRILPIHIQWSDQQYIPFFISSKLIKKYVYDSKIKTRLMWWYQHCSYSQPLETIVVNQRGLF